MTNDVQLDMRRVRDVGEAIQLSVSEVRALIDELPDRFDDLATTLDVAQGEVFSESEPDNYVVIKIVP